ncbi:MAG TPA: alginate lyase family protein [Gemmatimonadaceae bacterium]|nr:alginate lyase family protein [Gemmatimonadaceae bacterium]
MTLRFSLLTALTACAHVAASSPALAPAPHLLVLRGSNLAESRARLARGDTALRPAYDALMRDAARAMSDGPFSVMQKHRVPPSGDKHDYMSLAPYWWPDSTRPGGLPFVRRDGVVNPESRSDTDGPRLAAMADDVETLALAYYFSGESEYGARAAMLIHTWFLDPATRMYPNLRFAQAVPGVSDGRGTGILDTRHVTTVIDAIGLLEGAPGWSASDERAMRDWCRAYLGWLETSKQGRDERRAPNNHGTWYDSQVAALALFVGDSALARRTIAESATARIAAQIAPDGRQPEELARTRPFHYSLFNIEPYAVLAELGRHVGFDLWHYDAPNRASLKRAIAFLSPYFDPHVAWPTAQVSPANAASYLTPLLQAADAYHDPALTAAIRRIPAAALRTARARLLYPDALATSDSLDALMGHALGVAETRLRAAATSLDPARGYPRITRPDGSWTLVSRTRWTSGFFPGELWQMYAITRDPFWRAQAERWTAPLEVNDTRTNTHDLGFIVFTSFGNEYQLTGEAHARDVVLAASRSLATRFSPVVGAIKSWDTERDKDKRASWKYPVIIDNMMNLEMLFWSASHGGDPSWAELAHRHALTSARAHVRPDGSVAHVALFDPSTGKFLGRATWQGYSDSSAWARGQAWAIYGFAQAYEATRDPALLAAARKAADWYIAHAPADGVPYWDFRDPGIPNVERDASAGAIAASGLLSLSRDISDTGSSHYRTFADHILESLASAYIGPPPSMAVLAHSVGGKPQGVEVDVGIVYADYYLLDAIRKERALRGQGSWPE